MNYPYAVAETLNKTPSKSTPGKSKSQTTTPKSTGKKSAGEHHCNPGLVWCKCLTSQKTALLNLLGKTLARIELLYPTQALGTTIIHM